MLYCANPSCREPLGPDHVLLVTTAHARHFCSVECVEPARQAWARARVAAYQSSEGPVLYSDRLDHMMTRQRP